MVFMGLLGVPAVREPSHRITLFCEACEIFIFIQCSRRLPSFVGMLMRLEWWSGSVGMFKECCLRRW